MSLIYICLSLCGRAVLAPTTDLHCLWRFLRHLNTGFNGFFGLPRDHADPLRSHIGPAQMCFTVNVSVPEILKEIENISAINKGNHSTMTKQWTSNEGQGVSSLLYMNDSPKTFT